MADINRYISKIKTAIYGKDVRGSLADGLDAVNKETVAATALAQETEQRQTSLEKQFDDQIANMTLADPSSAELVAARTNVNTGKSYDTLGRRLDAEHADVTAQLAEKADQIAVDADRQYFENKFKSILDGSPDGVYSTLTDLQAAYPEGAQGVYVVQEDGNWYFWLDGSGWTAGGLYQAIEVADKSISFKKRTSMGTYGLIVSGSPVNVDLVNKRIVFPDDTNLSIGVGSSANISGMVVNLGENYSGFIFFNTSTLSFHVGYDEDASESDDILVGAFKNQMVTLNCTNYTVNGLTPIANYSVGFKERKAMGTYGFIFSEDIINIDLVNKVIQFPVNTNVYIGYGNAVPAPPTISLDTGYISGFIFYNTETNTFHVGYEQTVNEDFDILLGAFNFKNNTVILNASQYTINGKAPLSENLNLDRPADGIVHFSVDINTDLTIQNTQDDLSQQDTENIMQDEGVLFLPDKYSPTGKPLKLVIYCHGAGETIDSTTTSLPNPQDYLVNGLGYAVMDMNGVPSSLSGGTGLHYGSPLALQSYIKGYHYVIDNYNIDPNGCFVMGMSMGGLAAFMLTQSGLIPVLAQGTFCPVVDHFKQAFCHPWGDPASQRSQIAKMFNFDNYESFSGWTDSDYPSQEEIDYYMANINKVIGYNPIMKNTFNWNDKDPYNYGIETPEEQTAYNALVKFHKVPLKIWHNDDDQTVNPIYSHYLVTSIRNAGGLAYMRKFPSGGHAAWDNGEDVNTVDYKGNPYTVKTSGYELGLWFKRFE